MRLAEIKQGQKLVIIHDKPLGLNVRAGQVVTVHSIKELRYVNAVQIIVMDKEGFRIESTFQHGGEFESVEVDGIQLDVTGQNTEHQLGDEIHQRMLALTQFREGLMFEWFKALSSSIDPQEADRLIDSAFKVSYAIARAEAAFHQGRKQ